MENRKLVEVLTKRIAEKSPLIQVLIGPRQVGKQLLLKNPSLLGGGVSLCRLSDPIKKRCFARMVERGRARQISLTCCG